MIIFETYSQGMAVCLSGSSRGEHEVEAAGEVGAFSTFFFLQINDEGRFAGPRILGDVFVSLEIDLGDQSLMAAGLGHVMNMRGADLRAGLVGCWLDGFVFVVPSFIG